MNMRSEFSREGRFSSSFSFFVIEGLFVGILVCFCVFPPSSSVLCNQSLSRVPYKVTRGWGGVRIKERSWGFGPAWNRRPLPNSKATLLVPALSHT